MKTLKHLVFIGLVSQFLRCNTTGTISEEEKATFVKEVQGRLDGYLMPTLVILHALG